MRSIPIWDQPCTQAEFGHLVGIGQSAVSQLVTEGILPRDGTAAEWLLAYCARLREQAAGRYSDGPLDLGQERAALAKAQREGVEIKNAVLRGEYAEISLLGQTLATASTAVAERFDHLPGRVRRACPLLPQKALEQVLTVIAEARNEWVTQTVELVRASWAEHDDDEPDDPATDDDAAAT